MRDAEYHATRKAINYRGAAVRGNQASIAHKRNLALRIPTATRAPKNLISYNGIPAAMIKPVFQAACRIRFANPTVEDLVRLTKSSLDASIVSAILEGAKRLLPSDDSPDGQELRRAEMARKALQALVAETAFIVQLRKFQPLSMTEKQQNESIRIKTEAGSVNLVKATPDLLFLETTWLCGFRTNWVEYKNMFGFKSNPFVHGKIKKQLKRYTEIYGDGMVVFKLGYESEHLSIEGLRVMREAEVLHWLGSQQLICAHPAPCLPDL